ncbi:FtsX-like permease family protein [Pseudogracilibacillus auburnensis]|uniref:FtsX-like permease family protein n=1 Tax=Pseudogracilibacillus auburnensis TaxID=1494959 RepID=UPI001A95D6DA|nr:FtsX-like permease family protein [Pseudogracilibacillus auburnensis]MBO1001246.1 ABC transporter permease [Pseudogracilibacillus auburnensis]
MTLLVKTVVQFLLSHKRRNLFLIIGVALGVALIVVTQTLLASLEKSNEMVIKEQHGDFDLVVGYQTADRSVDADEIEVIKRMNEVENVSLFIYPYLNKETEMDMWEQPIYVGFEDEELALEHPFVSIAKGDFPKEGEALVSSTYAKQNELEIGSSIEMVFPPNGKKKVLISGFTEDNEALTNMAVFDYEWLQEATSNEGQTTAIMIKTDEIEHKQIVINQLRQLNHEFFIDERAEIDHERENIGGLGPIVQGLNFAIYLVSALIIISTMRMSVQEKQKELATLRLLGFEKKHVLSLVLMESLIVGLLSLLVGILLGLLLPLAFIDLFMDRMDVQYVELVFPWSNLLVSLGLFSLVILLSSLIPAYQASFAPPIVAYRGSANVQTLSKKYTITSVLFIFTGVVLFFINLFFWHSKSMYIVNAILFLVCAFIGIPLMFALCGKFLELISKWVNIPVEGVLAARNLLRQLKRNVQLSAIFTIGIVISILGMVILTTVKNETTEIIKETYPNDLSVSSIYSSISDGFPYSFYEMVEAESSVDIFFYTNEVVFLILNLPSNQDGLSDVILGIAGTDIQYSLDSGNVITENGLSSEEELSENGVMLTEETANKLGYNLGDTIVVNVSDNLQVEDKREFIIEGIITNADHINNDYRIFTSRKNMDDMFDIQTLYMVEMNIHQEDKGETVEAIKSLLQNPEFTNTILYDRAEELAQLEEQFLQRVFILYMAVGLMIMFTIIGLMNSAASSIKERLEELSMLRVLGCTKKRLLSLLLLEGTFLTGTVGMLAVGFSVISAYCLLESLNAQTFHALPILQTGLIIASPIIGAVAVLFPALWATRQGVMKALQ